MENKKRKIVCDSSSDVLAFAGVGFASAPMKIVTSVREYADDAELDVKGMVEDLRSYSGKSSTSCPNVGDWLRAFGDAEEVFCVTITGTLSGSYNSACVAGKTYEAEGEGRRVLVINSLSTGPEMKLIIERLAQYISEGIEFDAIAEKISEYTKSTGLLFMLESLKNLANNGRVKPLAARVAGLLGIRVVGKASDVGDLQQLDKCRGEKKALDSLLHHLHEEGYTGGKVRISHCFNGDGAERLAALIRRDFPSADIEIYGCRGLCSFYAERGGMLVGFERLAK